MYTVCENLLYHTRCTTNPGCGVRRRGVGVKNDRRARRHARGLRSVLHAPSPQPQPPLVPACVWYALCVWSLPRNCGLTIALRHVVLFLLVSRATTSRHAAGGADRSCCYPVRCTDHVCLRRSFRKTIRANVDSNSIANANSSTTEARSS